MLEAPRRCRRRFSTSAWRMSLHFGKDLGVDIFLIFWCQSDRSCIYSHTKTDFPTWELITLSPIKCIWIPLRGIKTSDKWTDFLMRLTHCELQGTASGPAFGKYPPRSPWGCGPSLWKGSCQECCEASRAADFLLAETGCAVQSTHESCPRYLLVSFWHFLKRQRRPKIKSDRFYFTLRSEIKQIKQCTPWLFGPFIFSYLLKQERNKLKSQLAISYIWKNQNPSPTNYLHVNKIFFGKSWFNCL